ncbi:hypothetical protein [Microbulbifer epialgicus]|uniref:Alternative ribosome-rescue factor n=1 Tax=Microbulbifer epialgicus TaxID=393907 RepID=A0ABV4NVL3_9GAMM
MKKETPKGSSKPRNYVARNPLLRKGGAHVAAKSGVRFKSKQKMLKEARGQGSSRDNFLAADFLRIFLPLPLFLV